MSIRRYNRDQIRAAVAHVLGLHQGPDNPITMLELFKASTGEVVIPAQRYNQTRIVRSIVDSLREEGVPVCYGDRGYYLARNEGELEPTVRHLESRAIAHFQTAAHLRRCSVADLFRRYQGNIPLQETSNDARE